MDYPLLSFIRHSSTAWTTEGRLQGSRDIPLSTQGVREANDQIPNLQAAGFAYIVSSPMQRCLQTAQVWANALHIPLLVDQRLSELDHGIWEGLFFQDLDLTPGYRDWQQRPFDGSLPSKQDLRLVAKHFECALQENAIVFPGKRGLIVTHKHIFALFLAHFQSGDQLSLSDCCVLSREPIDLQTFYRNISLRLQQFDAGVHFYQAG